MPSAIEGTRKLPIDGGSRIRAVAEVGREQAPLFKRVALIKSPERHLPLSSAGVDPPTTVRYRLP